jgi:hypothetical protein
MTILLLQAILKGHLPFKFRKVFLGDNRSKTLIAYQQ